MPSSKWSDITTNKLLLQWASNIRIQLSVFLSFKEDIISSKRNMFWSWYSRTSSLGTYHQLLNDTLGVNNPIDRYIFFQFFSGNSDGSTARLNIFSCPFQAQYIRLNPLEWNDGIGLRFDLLGCDIKSKLKLINC